jgi:hypothetical protein
MPDVLGEYRVVDISLGAAVRAFISRSISGITASAMIFPRIPAFEVSKERSWSREH